MPVATTPTTAAAQICKPAELSADDRIRWLAMLRESALDSPFFCPDYFQLVSEVRPNVLIARWEVDNQPVGFFPFQRKGRHGTAVGFPLNDVQGAVFLPGKITKSCQIMKQCGLDRFEFNHWLSGQELFSSDVWHYHDSPFADFSGGFENYVNQLKQRGGRSIKDVHRKSRKLTREVGPLRYEHHTTCPEVFAKLLAWKQQQFDRTGVVDLFAFDWVRELCDRLRFEDSGEFRGLMSALYAGDKLVAVHLGLCSTTVAHMWLPAYNVEYERYSPGMILLFSLLEELANSGIARIDFGKGQESFKENWMTGALSVGVGMVDGNPLRRFAYKTAFQAKRFMKRHSFLEAVSAEPMRYLSALRRKAIMR